MKKSVWIILPILALAGCSEATLGYGKGLSDIIEANLEESKVSYNKPTLKTIAPFSDSSEYMLVDSSSGLEVYSDANGDYRFYSLVADKEIATEIDADSYAVYGNSLAGFLLVTYDRFYTTAVTDGFGNKLASYYAIVNPTFYVEDDTLSIFAETDKEFAYRYTSTQPEKTYEGERRRKDTLAGFIDGEAFGLPDYQLNLGGDLWMVADENNKIIASFRLPNAIYSADEVIAVGGQLIAQKAYALPEEAENYAYYENGVKYALESYSLDILKGTYKEIDLPYLITNYSTLLKDKDGKYSLAAIDIREINGHKTLMDTDSVIIDKDGDIKEWGISASEINSFVKMNSGNFYNKSSKLILNDKLEPITTLPVSATYLKSLDCFYYFTGQELTLYDCEGEEIYQTRADYVQASKTQNLIYVTLDDDVSYVTIDFGEPTRHAYNGYSAESLTTYSFGVDGLLVMYNDADGLPFAYGIYAGPNQRQESKTPLTNTSFQSYTTFNAYAAYIEIEGRFTLVQWPMYVTYGD